MCAIRRGCCEGRVPEKCLKIIGARVAVCECVCVVWDFWRDGRQGWKGGEVIREQKLTARKVLNRVKK